MEKILEIIYNRDLNLEEKLQMIADEAIECAKKPKESNKDVSVGFEAILLFEFSLGWLCINYPKLRPDRMTILDVFRKSVLDMNLNR